ncbi:MAG: hypothetical protein MK078_06285 [Crocinitomicaceae bacterium]|nr:hypothetical protein [Crocinitomicaceae bacterium]
MKKFVFVTFVLGSLVFIGCQKYNGCTRAQKAWIRDYSESDTCGVLIELEDGTKLEPTNWTEHNPNSWSDGDLIWVSYKESSGASKCNTGEIVTLKCVSEREF